MIYQLKPDEYEKAREVLRALDDHLAVAAVLAGSAPGSMYVDDLAAPTCALVCGQRRFYLAGDARNRKFIDGLRALFQDTIYPRARQEGITAFVLYFSGPGWEAAIEEILAGRYPVKVERQYYERFGPKEVPQYAGPADLALRRVDAELLDDLKLKNRDALKGEMVSECPSVEEFLKTRLGVCAILGDEIAGWCLSEYNLGERCEIGIETLEKYQRRGIGKLTAGALIALARAQGIRRIGWDCYRDNAASVATALKLGFEKKSDYSVYITRVEK